MSKNLAKEAIADQKELNSLKGTLFSTLVFVGGGIVIFMVTLFVFYMIRI